MCAALWGGTSVAIRFTQDAWPPLGTAAIRFSLGTLFVGLWCTVRREPLRLQAGQLPAIVYVGVMLFAQIGLFHWGLTRTNASHGSVIIGSHCLWVALLAHFLLHDERLSLAKGVGLLAAIVGVGTVVFGQTEAPAAGRGDPATVAGDLILLVSAVLLAVKTVYSKHALGWVEPGKLLFWSNLVGSLLLCAASLLWEGTGGYRFTWPAVLAMLYQGLIVAGFCFAVWTAMLRRHRASQLAVFTFAQPLFGMSLAMLLRGDAPSAALLTGGLMVGAGIYLVTRDEGREAAVIATELDDTGVVDVETAPQRQAAEEPHAAREPQLE